MAVRLKSLPKLLGEQADASDPNVHAALSASAGTGKTQVLTARVLRLLLSGVDPEAILCLTFTKAGAAEMANRIGARLAAWVRMKDSELSLDLLNLGEANDPPTRDHARRLFARVLDAPGGLRIQTIHSFAQALLAAFPVEADLAPGFVPIEGRAEQELARTTLANLLADAELTGDSQLLADVQCLSIRLGEEGATRYLMRCAAAAETMADLGARDSIEPILRRVMSLPEGSVDELLARSCADDGFDCDLLRAMAEANRRWGTATGAKTVESIERWLAMPPRERASALPDLALVVFTGSGELRKVQAGLSKADADYERHAQRLSQAVTELMTIMNGARLAGDMAAGLRAGQAFAAAYTRAKRSAGVADFSDLIAWTRKLLATPGMGDWVRYKLDRRTDHILIDESQDTNREQWEIVQALAAEFFAGAGAAEGRSRTIFMVGDFKQAIFGFQGTDPKEFERARRWVREQSAGLLEVQVENSSGKALEFKDLSIEASFRSAQAVLDAVDATVRQVGYRNMGLPEEPKPHRAHFSSLPGTVELWRPFAVADEEQDDAGEEGWLSEDERLYAAALANQVRRWIEDAPTLASTQRALSPGDILILVRSRGELASLIVARLFEEGVPVAGIDRLHLQEPLAVKDLLAAIAFAVQPLDDLNLANLLVSPLIGWSQELLLELAYGRGATPLWQRLGERRGEKPEFEEARALLGTLLGMADYTTPHRFLETILSGPMEGRRKLYGRLGLAARDPIDELLASALEFEHMEITALDHFLAWFSRGEVEIKRDPSAPSNAVRIMTVHGAKGLEAPVVILADATSDPARLGGPARNLDFPIPGSGKVPLIRPRKAERLSPFAELIAIEEERELEEHWRLLYVGMTRAIERLIVAGIAPSAGSKALPETCWHVQVERALVSLGSEWEEEEGRPVLRYRGSVPARRLIRRPPAIPLEPPAVPAWARIPAPAEARPPRPLAPSAIAEDREAAPPPSPEMRAAVRRGTLIHQLLERLPEVEEKLRLEIALRWLEHSAGVEDAALRDEVAATACAVLANPQYAPFFGPGSFGEAPLAAVLPDGRVVAGTVDRLLVEADRISVVDYKTGRVPVSEAQIPVSHRLQMEAYRDALGVIFPGRSVHAALLYTGGPSLFEVGG